MGAPKELLQRAGSPEGLKALIATTSQQLAKITRVSEAIDTFEFHPGKSGAYQLAVSPKTLLEQNPNASRKDWKNSADQNFSLGLVRDRLRENAIPFLEDREQKLRALQARIDAVVGLFTDGVIDQPLYDQILKQFFSTSSEQKTEQKAAPEPTPEAFDEKTAEKVQGFRVLFSRLPNGKAASQLSYEEKQILSQQMREQLHAVPDKSGTKRTQNKRMAELAFVSLLKQLEQKAASQELSVSEQTVWNEVKSFTGEHEDEAAREHMTAILKTILYAEPTLAATPEGSRRVKIGEQNTFSEHADRRAALFMRVLGTIQHDPSVKPVSLAEFAQEISNIVSHKPDYIKDHSPEESKLFRDWAQTLVGKKNGAIYRLADNFRQGNVTPAELDFIEELRKQFNLSSHTEALREFRRRFLGWADQQEQAYARQAGMPVDAEGALELATEMNAIEQLIVEYRRMGILPPDLEE